MANSWMQTPQGYTIATDPAPTRAVMTDFWQVVFTPSFMPAAAPRVPGVVDGGRGADDERQRLVPAQEAPPRPRGRQHEARPAGVHPVRDGQRGRGRAQPGHRGHQRAAAQARVDGGAVGQHLVRAAVPRRLGRRDGADDDRDLDPVPAQRPRLPEPPGLRRGHQLLRARPDPAHQPAVPGLPLHVRDRLAVRPGRPARWAAARPPAAAVHLAPDAVGPGRDRVLRRGGDHRRLVDGRGRPPAVGRVQRPRDGRRRVAPAERDRRRDLARHVHRPVRAPPGAVPVPAQPPDPARARAARGRRDRRPGDPARHASARCSPAGTVPRRAESGNDPRRSLVRPVRRHRRRATSSSTASTWASGSCSCRWPATTPSGGPSSTASARSGTATRSGSSSRAACCSPCSRSRTRRCSRASTSRSCWSCS